jgi:transposase
MITQPLAIPVRLSRAVGGAGPCRSPDELADEFEPCAQTTHNWVKQSDRRSGCCIDGVTGAEQDGLRHLRREVRQLRQEREILAKAAAWFARETNSIPSGSSNS